MKRRIESNYAAGESRECERRDMQRRNFCSRERCYLQIFASESVCRASYPTLRPSAADTHAKSTHALNQSLHSWKHKCKPLRVCTAPHHVAWSMQIKVVGSLPMAGAMATLAPYTLIGISTSHSDFDTKAGGARSIQQLSMSLFGDTTMAKSSRT